MNAANNEGFIEEGVAVYTPMGIMQCLM